MADVRSKIIQIIATECEVDEALIVPEASLDDLGISSVDLVQVMFQIEEASAAWQPSPRSIRPDCCARSPAR